MPQRHAKLLKVDLGQLGQNISVNFVRAERGLILIEAEASQPTSEVHGGALISPGAYHRPRATARPGQKAVLPSLPGLPLVRLCLKHLDVLPEDLLPHDLHVRLRAVATDV